MTIEHRERREPIPTKPAREGIREALIALNSLDLPVLQQRGEIAEILRSGDRVIIEADTGSGKSTVMPILLLEDAITRNPQAKVLVTQPRRVAAESLANYLGEKMGESLVDFRHGSKKDVRPTTQLEFTMEGSLLRDLIADPTLDKYDAILLDEVHERSINLDTILPLLKIAQEKRRLMGRPLKVVLTSATLDRDKVMTYFEGAKHKSVEGRMFPVTEYYEEHDIEPEEVMKKAADVSSRIIQKGEEPGDILIFMPGKAEIEKTIQELKKKENITDDDIEIVPLLGGDESSESAAKISQKSTKRRIFVATNVAETSITIPSVRIVIDSGLMRLNIFDPETGISSLETREHTQSNAKQRKGRAGRTAEGTYHALFTESGLASRDVHLKPEILRTDLVAQILLMKSIGINDFENFDFLDHPGIEKINRSISTLKKLGALKEDGSISEIGAEMAKIGTEPHYARMLVEARRLGCEDDVALIIGLLSNTKSIFDRRFKPKTSFAEKYAEFYTPGSDIATLLKIWNDYVKHNATKESRQTWQEEKGIKTFQLYSAASTRKDLLLKKRIDDSPIDTSEENIAKVTLSVVRGLMDNIVIRKDDGYETLSGTSGVQINRESSLIGTRPEFFASGSIRRFGGSETPPIASYNIQLSKAELQALSPDILPAIKAPTTNVHEPSEVIEENPETTPETDEDDHHAEEEHTHPADIHGPGVTHTHSSPHESHNAHTSVKMIEVQRNFIEKVAYNIRRFVHRILKTLRIRR